MSYFLAPSLVLLRKQVNDLFPKRDKSSDGWIGDPSHQARPSDHNPDWKDTLLPGVVRAIDLDVGPDGRADMDLATVLLKAVIGDDRVHYVIFNGKIYSRSYGWAPRAYKGSNPHRSHIHISLNGGTSDSHTGRWTAKAAAENTRAWRLPGVAVVKPTPPTKLGQQVRLADVARAARIWPAERNLWQVTYVQWALRAAGFDPGLADGYYGPKTRHQMERYQRSKGLKGTEANGYPNAKSLTLLGKDRFRLIV